MTTSFQMDTNPFYSWNEIYQFQTQILNLDLTLSISKIKVEYICSVLDPYASSNSMQFSSWVLFHISEYKKKTEAVFLL